MNDFGKLMAPLRRSLGNMIARGVVTAVNSATKMQTLQIRLMADESKSDVEHFEPYGYTSNPKPGAEEVALFPDGDRSHGLVIVVADRRYRLEGLLSGEMAIHDDQGQKVHLTRDGIVIKTAKKCRIDALDIELHASHSYSWDVNGFGERWTYLNGTTWERKTWQQGATVLSVSQPINPPEGP